MSTRAAARRPTSANRAADIDLAPGETVVCTFTNKKALNGKIVVKKQTTPEEDPNVTDFGFAASGGLTPATFTLKDDGEPDVQRGGPGTYTSPRTRPRRRTS